MNIIPAILESSYAKIEEYVESILHDAKFVHVDICDGLLAGHKSWPYSESQNNRIEENYHIKKLLNEDDGLPSWESINYEFDLMIQNPNLTMDVWTRIGAERLIIHPVSFKDNDSVTEFIIYTEGFMIESIIAVTYDEYTIYKDFIKDLIDRKLIKSLQIMTIKTIGAQGQKFDERTIELIKNIKADFVDLIIRVDGGINNKTIDNLIDMEADDFIIGSAIFSSGNARENLNYFKNMC
jgi:pentose-5-phosphate-3-epimerase